MTSNIDAVLFDAYGTLYDVYSVLARCEQAFPGKGTALSQLWRTKQLEYTWLRSLMGKYEDFEVVTRAALRFACKSLQLALDETSSKALMDEYLRLATFPEVKGALAKLSHLKLCILSNGSPRLLQSIVRNAGLESTFTQVISVHSLKVFKPHPSVYQLGVDATGVPKERIAFISSNYWDAAGATAFGFRTFWINRSKAVPDELGYPPAAVLSSLDELVTTLS